MDSWRKILLVDWMLTLLGLKDSSVQKVGVGIREIEKTTTSSSSSTTARHADPFTKTRGFSGEKSCYLFLWI